MSWLDAQAYASWVSKRLPTEAEWEYAARRGAGADTFPFNSTGDPMALCGAGRHWIDGAPGTSPVANFPSTGDLYDLVGNVWQWCADRYSPRAYSEYLGQISSHSSADVSGLRVRRGGAWNVLQAFRLRCSNRGAYQENAATPNIGFRCAL